MLVIEFSCDLPILLSDMYTREMTSEKKYVYIKCYMKTACYMLHQNNIINSNQKLETTRMYIK